MSSLVADLEEKGEFVLLRDNAQYKEYFTLINRAFEYLLSWYHEMEGADDEEKVIGKFLSRILYTTQLLALKSVNAQRQTLRLDLNDSGYPHLIGFVGIETDLRQRDELLRTYSSEEIIRQAILTHIFVEKNDPKDLVAGLAYRRYLDLLDETKVLIPFTPGELVLKSTAGKRRNYMFSWACYDFKTNIPFLHMMLFDQDISEEPLEQEGMGRSRFMDVIRQEGSSVPPLDVMAINIDQSLESIHPKIIKRLKLGPILSTAFSLGEHPLLGYLKEFAKPEEFIFHLRDEMILSIRSEEKKKGWLSAPQVREIFAVPRDNAECAEAGVTRIYRKMMLPHHLLQHLDPNDPVVRQYDQKITYTRKGQLHGI